MTTIERRFFIYLWRALGGKPGYGSSHVFHQVREVSNLDVVEALQWAGDWEDKGWFAREKGDRLALLSSGHFTLAGAKEVAYQAARYVQDAALAGPDTTAEDLAKKEPPLDA